MSPLEQIVLAFQAMTHAARQLFRGSLWAPWLVLVALQGAVLIGFWWFAHPALSRFVAPLIRRLAGERALHYPDLFLSLPRLYARADVVIAAVTGTVVAGAATALFGAWFSGQPLRPSVGLKRAAVRAGALILGNLPLVLGVFAISFALERWAQAREGSGLLARLAPLLVFGAAVLLQAFFVWMNPLLMLGRYTLTEAFAALPDAASRGGWTALTLALASALPLLPLQLLARNPDRLVDRGVPELVGWLLAAQIAIAALAAFLRTGGGALAYQGLVGPALEGEA
jgi:hypothetical protein